VAGILTSLYSSGSVGPGVGALLSFATKYNSVQARDDSVQQDIIHKITTSLSSNTHTRTPRSITALRLELSESE